MNQDCKISIEQENNIVEICVDGNCDDGNSSYGSGIVIIQNNNKYDYCFGGNNESFVSMINPAR